VPDNHFHHREPGNDALLSAMTKAGCFHVQIGFQTVNPGSLRSAGTAQNRTGEYCKVVRASHRHKILVLGFFMFGFDADEENISREAEEAIRKIDLDDACLCILTPYPGTEKYEQFKREGRLMSKARPGYGWSNAVFQPANMSPVELEQGVQGVYERLHGRFMASGMVEDSPPPANPHQTTPRAGPDGQGAVPQDRYLTETRVSCSRGARHHCVKIQ
jgi:radical SAM superfamily enzyme YgiQ (UPF0313 family)